MPQINEAGLNLIKEFEGCDLEAYRDSVGVPTIGYGHTAGVQMGQVITQEQATEFLQEDLKQAAADVARIVKPQLTPNQFAALVSIVFNVGPGAIEGTRFGAALNASEWQTAADLFLEFDHAGGRVLPGLLRRRQAERTLFLQS